MVYKQRERWRLTLKSYYFLRVHFPWWPKSRGDTDSSTISMAKELVLIHVHIRRTVWFYIYFIYHYLVLFIFFPFIIYHLLRNDEYSFSHFGRSTDVGIRSLVFLHVMSPLWHLHVALWHIGIWNFVPRIYTSHHFAYNVGILRQWTATFLNTFFFVLKMSSTIRSPHN